MPENPIIGKARCPYCGVISPIRREKGGTGRMYMTCAPISGGCYYLHKAPPKLLGNVEKFQCYVGPWKGDTLDNVSEDNVSEKDVPNVSEKPDTLPNVSKEDTPNVSGNKGDDKKGGGFGVPQFI